MDGRHLSQLLEEAAGGGPTRRPSRTSTAGGRAMPSSCDGADRLATRLARWGVDRGDRVGLWLPKSLEAVTAIHGILRTGASYVPVDPTGPAARAAGILAASGVKAAIVAAELVPALRDGMARQRAAAAPDRGRRPRPVPAPSRPRHTETTPPISASAGDCAWSEVIADDAPSPLLPPRAADDLAYILFTSGSTGQPKGVMLSHANAFTFLDWCQQALGPWEDGDRFASHAPFHFDLSVFDLFAACQAAATLVLIGENLGKDPEPLGDFLTERQISVWYSAPSILALLAQHGRLDRPGYTPPRLVLFAGEVFPVAALARLQSALAPGRDVEPVRADRDQRLHRLSDSRDDPARSHRAVPDRPGLPAAACTGGRRTRPRRAARNARRAGHRGPGVMRGYFGQPELTAAAFLVDDDGTRWYRTGDLVRDMGAGCFQFHGRRDRMVKKRGYRIELGEIESALYRHDGVDRAGVVAQTGDVGVSIAAFVALKPNQKRSIIAMKRHCTDYLPHYMIPDTITFLDDLPATSTDKVDYQRLRSLASEQGPRS